MPDKKQAWEDIIRFVQSKDTNVRWSAAGILGSIFPHASDKNQAWQDIIQLTQDKDTNVRRGAAYSLGIAFQYFPNKEEAWEDMHKLVEDKDEEVRCGIAQGISVAFADISNKEQAWEDLRQLIHDKNREVRWNTAEGVSVTFLHIPDKKQAWKDIYRLAKNDEDLPMRFHVVELLGGVFSYVHNKKWAFDDLMGLTTDDISILRVSANYSLGRASIFKATEAKDKESFKKELEKALEFFEKSSKEAQYFKPASFCLPFYKSFYTITFKRQIVHTEVQKYLTEAKRTVRSSKNKEKLLEAVENLANALREAQGEIDFDEMKRDISAYRRYCERAIDLLSETEDKAPGATNLIRRGLPIIDQKIKEILTEIQENAKTLCKQTKDTPLEDLGKEVIRVSQAFPQIRDPIGLEKGVNNMQIALSAVCAKMPEEERGEACELLKKAGDEPYIEDKLPLINMVLSKISSQLSAAKNIETVEKKLNEIMVSLKPGIREELVITVGAEFAGTGAKHEIHIPLQEITYPEIKNDLEKIKGKTIFKLASLPAKLADKVKAYLLRTKKDELLKHLT